MFSAGYTGTHFDLVDPWICLLHPRSYRSPSWSCLYSQYCPAGRPAACECILFCQNPVAECKSGFPSLCGHCSDYMFVIARPLCLYGDNNVGSTDLRCTFIHHNEFLDCPSDVLRPFQYVRGHIPYSVPLSSHPSARADLGYPAVPPAEFAVPVPKKGYGAMYNSQSVYGLVPPGYGSPTPADAPTPSTSYNNYGLASAGFRIPNLPVLSSNDSDAMRASAGVIPSTCLSSCQIHSDHLSTTDTPSGSDEHRNAFGSSKDGAFSLRGLLSSTDHHT